MQDRAFNVKDRLSSTTTLTVNIGDVEDQPPAFQYVGCPLNNRGVCITPTYTATVIYMIHRSCHTQSLSLSMGTCVTLLFFCRFSVVWRRVYWLWNPIEFWLWIRILQAGHRFATVSTKDRHQITVNTLKSIPIPDGLNRSNQPIVLWSINLIWLSRWVSRENLISFRLYLWDD